MFYSNIFKDVKSCISSTENNQNENAASIINYLENVWCGNCGVVDSELGLAVESILVNILFHPSIISDTYSFIDEIYRGQEKHWLEKKGLLVSRVLEILIPEMSKITLF